MTEECIPLHGWIILDKPSGCSSNHLLSRLRKKLGGVKAGYAGTLDPFATGVLPVALGEATKLMDYLVDTLKTYTFIIRWGESTDTDDSTGQILETSSNRPSLEAIEKALPQFHGTISQFPPLYSAIKIQGKRACDRMRNQESVTLAPRSIFVQSFRLVNFMDADHAEFQVTCGKGTYIRSLARDLGKALGTVSHAESLCRESVGRFLRKDALPYDKLLEARGHFELQQCLRPMTSVLDDIPAVVIGNPEVEKIRHGQSIALPHSGISFPRVIQLQDESHCLVAMSTVEGDRIMPQRVFVYQERKQDVGKSKR